MRYLLSFLLILGLGLASVAPESSAVTLNDGDILAVSIDTDSIVLVDPVTGIKTVVSSGGLLSDNFPIGVTVEGNGDILVTHNGPSGGRIIRIDPVDGTQTIVVSGFTNASGITTEPSGDILITDLNTNAITRVDPITGFSSVVSSDGFISGPLGIAVEASGDIVVTSRNNSQIVRIDPMTGTQSVVSSGGDLGSPQWLVVNSSGDIFITTPNRPIARPLDSAVIKVDPSSGAQSVVAAGGLLFSPRGIDVDANGQLVVANGNNKILRVDPVTGGVVEISGFGIISGTSGLAIVGIDMVPNFDCVGFQSPIDKGPVTVKKNRALPFKAQLFDNGLLVTDLDIIAPPVIQVLFDSGSGGSPIDVTDDALPAGQGTEGNQFEFGTDKWQFNLKTKNYTAAGNYTVTMKSGDESEYTINPECSGIFVIE